MDGFHLSSYFHVLQPLYQSFDDYTEHTNYNWYHRHYYYYYYYYYYYSLLRIFYTSISWWFITGVWVTVSFLKSPIFWPTQSCCSLDSLYSSSYFLILQSLYQSFSDGTNSTNYNWYHCYFHVPHFFQFPSKGPATYLSF